MADITVATLAATLEMKTKGFKEAAAEIDATAKHQEQANIRWEAAKAILASTEAALLKLGMGYREAKVKATEGSIAIQAHTAAIEQNKRLMAEMSRTQKEVGAGYLALAAAVKEEEAALASAEAQYGATIKAVKEHEKALTEEAAASKQAAGREESIGQVYGSNVWQIRSYSRGLSDFVGIVSGIDRRTQHTFIGG